MKAYHEKSRLSKNSQKKLPNEIKDYMQLLIGQKFYGDCRFANEHEDEGWLDRDDSSNFVVIAESGTGDSWLIRLEDEMICFLDHEIWEEPESIYPMGISFEQFVIMADLVGQFEKEPATVESIRQIKALLCTIERNLADNYPYEFITDDEFNKMLQAYGLPPK